MSVAPHRAAVAELVDVAIVGGGPAGCATALSLRSHAPSLSVVVIEASDYEAPRMGEMLPPIGRRLLEHLGLWDAFQRQGHTPVHATAAAWGSPVPREQHFMFGARGHGWHLDRQAFDRWLADETEARGVTVLRRTRVRDVTRDEARQGEPSWHLTLESSPRRRPIASSITARCVVDATGRAAFVARRLGGRASGSDRLVAFVRRFGQAGAGDPRTLVEAFADGWWYTAGLPGGGRVAVCFTDADIARQLRLHASDGWTRALAHAPSVAAALANSRADGPIVGRAAGSRRLEPSAGERWLAVGDAGALFDPLSSQGIVKALRSGVFASYTLADFLRFGDFLAFSRYDRRANDEFRSYNHARAAFYRVERRWPQTAFWRRRSDLESALMLSAALPKGPGRDRATDGLTTSLLPS